MPGLRIATVKPATSELPNRLMARRVSDKIQQSGRNFQQIFSFNHPNNQNIKLGCKGATCSPDLSELFTKGWPGANYRQHIDYGLAVNRARVAHISKPFRTVIRAHARSLKPPNGKSSARSAE